ncbi:hypothetical protein GWI33_005351 [Rhynchophorus ferrugineus]|uniref:Proteasome assembly chaperone 3 n=1 Tax=Rhynchophorus ferrugineus TaxID=354439 RepID=A0A834IYV8_RHYFE|nr:hypothetical protein GWI33_005351 [Rhynchophorus ferrugineus]
MDLADSITSSEINNTSVASRNFAALLENNRTEFVISKFENYLIFIISQYAKVGNLYAVTLEQLENGVLNPSPVYDIRHLFGDDSIEIEAGVRFVVGQLNIRTPIVMCLTLINYELETLRLVVEALKIHFSIQENGNLNSE